MKNEIKFDKMSKKTFEQLYNKIILEPNVTTTLNFGEWLEKNTPDKFYCPICFFNKCLQHKNSILAIKK